jgi:hypothetical protein
MLVVFSDHWGNVGGGGNEGFLMGEGRLQIDDFAFFVLHDGDVYLSKSVCV